MILLDTNVVSALMQDPADERVLDWVNGRRRRELWVPSITVFEIMFGLERIRPSRRYDRLRSEFEVMLHDDLRGQIAVFDEEAARAAADLAARLERVGVSAETKDLQIAGIAISRRAALCTRNVRHFQDAGIALVNPWA